MEHFSSIINSCDVIRQQVDLIQTSSNALLAHDRHEDERSDLIKYVRQREITERLEIILNTIKTFLPLKHRVQLPHSIYQAKQVTDDQLAVLVEQELQSRSERGEPLPQYEQTQHEQIRPDHSQEELQNLAVFLFNAFNAGLASDRSDTNSVSMDSSILQTSKPKRRRSGKQKGTGASDKNGPMQKDGFKPEGPSQTLKQKSLLDYVTKVENQSQQLRPPM